MKAHNYFGTVLLMTLLVSFCLTGCPTPDNDGKDLPGATVTDGVVGGTLGEDLRSPTALKISLSGGAAFKAVAVNADLSSWVRNAPSGIGVKAFAAVEQNSTGLTLKFDGKPTAESADVLAITIPAAFLNHSGASDITVTENKAASWDIGADTPDAKYDLRFGVISDTHVGASNAGSPIYPNDLRLNKVLDWYNKQPHVKTLAIVGDLVDMGTDDSQWNKFKTSLNNHLRRLNLISVLGNHEGYAFAGRDQAISFEQATGQRTNYHHVINGYHFIMLSPGPTFDEPNLRTNGNNGVTNDEGAPFYSGIKEWAERQVAEACAAAPGKPVFVMLHHPIKNTVFRSDHSYTATFGAGEDAWFKDYPQVVVFAGHIHAPNSDPRSIWQGGSPGFTAVNTVSTHYQNMDTLPDGMWADYSETGFDGNKIGFISQTNIWNKAAAQGMIVKVKGSVVTIENYDFDVSELVPTDDVYPLEEQTWSFDVAHPESFPYTRTVQEARKQAPVFVAGAADGAITGKVTVKVTTANTVTVEFDQAAIPTPNPGLEVVHSYRFDFINRGTGTMEKQIKQWSDFMLTPRLRKPKLEQLIDGLTAGTAYELRIYAYGSFQKRSPQYLTVDFSTK